MKVVELRSRAELGRAWPVMRELRDHLDEERWLELMDVMTPDGYRLLSLQEDDGTIVALAGIRIATNLYYGRHVWVDELVTTGGARSRGYGRMLLGRVEDLAAAESCEVVALSSALHRADAHRFYEQHMGYDRVSYSFVKKVRPGAGAAHPPPR
ncbi:MAG: GNAT family N-acetyltransferase [Actinomycetota bacterium]